MFSVNFESHFIISLEQLSIPNYIQCRLLLIFYTFNFLHLLPLLQVYYESVTFLKFPLSPPPPNLKIFLRLPFIEIFLWNQVIILAQGLLIFLLPTCSQRSCSSQMDFQDISLVLNGVLFSAGDFLFSWSCQKIASVFSKMHFIEAYSQNHEIC